MYINIIYERKWLFLLKKVKVLIRMKEIQQRTGFVIMYQKMNVKKFSSIVLSS